MISWKILALLLGLVVSAGIHLRYIRPFRLSPRAGTAAYLGLLICCLGICFGDFSFQSLTGELLFPWWQRLFYFLFVLILTIFWITLLADLILGLPCCLWRRSRVVYWQSSRVRIVLLSLALGITCWGQYEGLKLPEIRKITLASSRISRPLTVALVTDLHINRLSDPDRIRRVVRRINRLDPDLTVLAGDILDDQIGLIRDLARPLGNLKAHRGVFFTTGNHEFYHSHLDAGDLMTKLGIQVLDNHGRRIRKDVFLGGIPDLKASRRHGERADPRKALKSSRKSQYRILISHEPYPLKGADLVLSGHTHGGQFFPFQIPAWLKNGGLLAGLYEMPSGQRIIVSRGAGTWGPAFRIFAPGDILLITLLPENNR